MSQVEEILALRDRGRSVRQIADQLGLAPRTVDNAVTTYGGILAGDRAREEAMRCASSTLLVRVMAAGGHHRFQTAPGSPRTRPGAGA